jgi:hypothetical protein
MKLVIGIVVGAVVAIACVWAIEAISHLIYPIPPGTDFDDPAVLAAYFETVPLGAKLWIVAAWFVGALAGAWVANAIARRALAGWIVTLLVIAGGVATMMMITHPAWMWAGGIALPLVAAWLAQRLAKVAL